MRPDIQFAQDSFNTFNALIFEGKLPPVKIVMSKGQRYLGKMEYRTVKGLFGISRGHDNFLMRISTERDMSVKQWEDVIIHEMIHYYIAYFNLKDRSAHGPLFRSMMNDINNKFGRHIVISHKLTEPDNRIRTHIVCVALMPDGQYGLSVYNPGSLLSSLLSAISQSSQSKPLSSAANQGFQPGSLPSAANKSPQPGSLPSAHSGATSQSSASAVSITKSSIFRASARELSIAEKCIPALPRLYNVREIHIYATSNTFFNRYPHSRSPKIYKVSANDLFPALNGAMPLHFDGRFLTPSCPDQGGNGQS